MLKHFSISVFFLMLVLFSLKVAATEKDYFLNNPVSVDLNTAFESNSCNNSLSNAFMNCNETPSLFLALNEPINNEEETSKPENDISKSFYLKPISSERDWDGLKQDTTLFVFYQFLVIGVLYVMPEDISGWSDEVKDTWSFDTYMDNISHVAWDEDKSWINYFLHPYWGGTYYVRARNRGYDKHSSVWYSVFLSAVYEFGAEALFETPSAQDLIITPLGGYFFGEYMMKVREKTKADAAAKGRLSFLDKTLLVVTDPLGFINHSTTQILGFAGQLTFQPITSINFPNSSDTQAISLQADNKQTKEDVFKIPLKMGLKLTINW